MGPMGPCIKFYSLWAQGIQALKPIVYGQGARHYNLQFTGQGPRAGPIVEGPGITFYSLRAQGLQALKSIVYWQGGQA